MKSINIFFSKMTLEKKIILSTLTPVLTVLFSIKSILIGLSIIIFIDLITGIRKSLFLKGMSYSFFDLKFWKALLKKELYLTVKSEGLRKTWRKTYEYGIGIIIFAVFESMVLKIDPIVIMDRPFSITELAATTATLIEIWSVFENMEAVSGKNLLKRFVDFLPESLQKLLRGKKNEPRNK